MKIAVLAWGSLIWDRRELAIATEFEPIGPHIALEFTRISRDGRLTLVLDEACGSSCGVYAALSAFDCLEAALENLWGREGSQGELLPKDVRTHGRVGWVDVVSDKHSQKSMERHPKAVDAIKCWAKANAYDAVIWTALASNFHEKDKAGKAFSVDAALHYLAGLDNRLSFAVALNYIWSAPPEVDTPLRRAVNERWAQKG